MVRFRVEYSNANKKPSQERSRNPTKSIIHKQPLVSFTEIFMNDKTVFDKAKVNVEAVSDNMTWFPKISWVQLW